MFWKILGSKLKQYVGRFIAPRSDSLLPDLQASLLIAEICDQNHSLPQP